MTYNLYVPPPTCWGCTQDFRRMFSMRIGIDVGGTNTDAVLMDGRRVAGWAKSPTTRDVSSGITAVLSKLLSETGAAPGAVSAVMLGTTHFTNAVVERRNLSRTAVIRIGL